MNSLNFKSKNTSRFKYITSTDNNQVLKSDISKPLKLAYTTTPSQSCLEKSENYFIELVRTLKFAKLHILKEIVVSILYLGHRFSQEYIARRLKITREWVCKVMRYLNESGLILKKRIKNKLGRDEVCSYNLNPILYRQRVRYLLSNILPALAIISLSLLTINGQVVNKPIYIDYISGSIKKFTPNYEYNLDTITNTKHTNTYQDQKYKTNMHIQVAKPYTNTSMFSVDITICKSYSAGVQQIKDEHMKQNVTEITDVINGVKCLKLTLWGKIKLMAYPDDSVLWAQEQFKSARNINSLKDKFAFFASRCYAYCTQRGIQPDFNFARGLAIKYNMPVNPDCYLDGDATNPTTENKKSKEPFSGVSVKPVGWNKTARQKYEEYLSDFNIGIGDKFTLNTLKAKADCEDARIPKLQSNPKHDEELNYIEVYRENIKKAEEGKFAKSKYLTPEQVLNDSKARAIVYAKEKRINFPEAGIIFTQTSLPVTDYSQWSTERKAAVYKSFLIDYEETMTAMPAAEAEMRRAALSKINPGNKTFYNPEIEYEDEAYKNDENSNDDSYGEALPWLP